jgi:hypothetical protein
VAARKKSAKKAPAKPTRARKVSKSAAPAKKPAAAPARKKAAAKKPSRAAQPAKKPVAAPAPAPPPAATPPAAGTVLADEVLLGHVMALRPRVHVGFKPSAFADAKRALADERYATIQEAAHAVVQKAIEISNESPSRNPFSRR